MAVLPKPFEADELVSIAQFRLSASPTRDEVPDPHTVRWYALSG